MTVVAYRDGVLAADSGVWQGGIIVANTQKVFRLSDGSLFAASGPRSVIERVFDCFEGKSPLLPPPLPDRRDFVSIRIEASGVIWRMDGDMIQYSCPDAPWYVLGAHDELLFGALAAGASAIEAVEIAIKYGDCAGGIVQSLGLNG